MPIIEVKAPAVALKLSQQTCGAVTDGEGGGLKWVGLAGRVCAFDPRIRAPCNVVQIGIEFGFCTLEFPPRSSGCRLKGMVRRKVQEG